MPAALDEFPLSTSSFIADTQHLDLPQTGAYLLILMTMWRAGGWIDADEKKLAVICKLTLRKWRNIAPALRPFFLFDNGKISQKRLLAEVKNYSLRVQKNRANAGAGGRAKALKNIDQGLANANFSLELGESTLSTLSKLVEDSGKEESKGRGRRSAARLRAMLSEHWKPTDRDRLFASSKGFDDSQIDGMAEKFVNHHRSRGTKIADIAATWRTWVGNEIRFTAEREAQQRSRGGRVSFGDIARGGVQHHGR